MQNMEIDEFEDEEVLVLELSSPLEKFRPARYLWVSHLAEQLWCEQRLEYSFTRPVKITENIEDSYYTSPFKQDNANIQNCEENAAMITLSSEMSKLRLSQELHSEEYIGVEVKTDEDIFAIKAMKLYDIVNGLPKQKNCEKVPIFGWLSRLLLVGKIHELRYDNNSKSIEIHDYKIRKKPYKPGQAQIDKNKFQLTIYTHLLKNICDMDIEKMCSELELDRLKLISVSIKKKLSEDVSTLNDVFMKLKKLPKFEISKTVIHYRCDNIEFTKLEMNYDEDWLMEKIYHFEDYWHGHRFIPQGVDVAEVWKCDLCPYINDCDWRKMKCSPRSLIF